VTTPVPVKFSPEIICGSEKPQKSETLLILEEQGKMMPVLKREVSDYCPVKTQSAVNAE